MTTYALISYKIEIVSHTRINMRYGFACAVQDEGS